MMTSRTQKELNRTSSRSGGRTVLGAVAAAAMLCAAQSATAQRTFPPPTLSFTSYVYTMKFACGGASLLADEQSLEDPVALPYEDFEPGRYATAINFLNTGRTTRNVTVSVAAEGLAGNLAVATFSLSPFATRRVGCLTIMNQIRQVWPTSLDGQLIEGYAYVIQNADDLDVEAIYSYTFLAEGFGTAFEEVASSEGVGASLDVVKVLPREIDGPIRIPVPLPTP